MTTPADLPRKTSAPAWPERREWALILLVVVLGLTLRCLRPERMAVEHFDEGVYASNLWFNAEQDFRYPARHLYAPPLVPGLLESSQLVLGPTHWGTMLFGILAGTLTIGLLWWAVRGWFGPPAGLAAAALAAMSQYHLIYSRTALTEPVLCLLLLVSVYWLWLAVVNIRFRSGLAAGLFTGLAWSAKYNGWLPLAIGVAGVSGWAVFPNASQPVRGRRYLILGFIAVAAVLIFSPVWWGLQEVGGYSAVQENHARYFTGFSGWGSAWNRQLANHRYFDGPLSWLSLPFAVICSRFGGWLKEPNSNSSPRRWLWLLYWSVLLAALGMALGTSVVIGLMAFLWLVIACPWWRKTRTDVAVPDDLAYWLIAAWFLGLFLTTPLYTPYPRLSLPWLMSAWILAAAMLGSRASQQLLIGNQPWQSTPKGIAVMALLALASTCGIAWTFPARPGNRSAIWQDRAGMEKIAARMRKLVDAKFSGEAGIYVFAEPALFYHLRANHLELVAPIADLGFADHPKPLPVLLAIGPHAERSPEFQADFQKHAHQFELLASFAYRPSELVLLNEYPPDRLRDADFEREQTIKLFRLKFP